MICRDFIERIDEFLETSMPAEHRVECESHLGECPYCRDYLRTYRDTISLLRDALAGTPDAEVSPETARKLAEAMVKARNPSA